MFISCPCPVCVHGLSVDTDCPRTVRSCRANCFTDVARLVALDIAWMFHSCCANRFATCQPDANPTASRFASRTSPAIARTFTNHCASHCADIHRCCVRCFPPLLGLCVAAAQMLRRTLRDCCADAARLANRLLRVCDADCFLIC